MRSKEQYKAIFEMHIDFNLEEKEALANSGQDPILCAGNKYYLRNEKEVLYEDIVKETKTIINKELTKELKKYIECFNLDIQVQAVYDGSIVIFFTALLSFLDLVGGLKDLYDVSNIIREISERHVSTRLSEEFGSYFRVETMMIAPDRHNYGYIKEELKESSGENQKLCRDTFFYYLLITNIILILILGLLVGKAVQTMYFVSA